MATNAVTAALKQPSFFKTPDVETILEELIKGDPNNSNEFKPIITKYEHIWNAYHKNKNGKISRNSFKEIHNLAIKKRIELGISKADETVLVALSKASGPDNIRQTIKNNPPLITLAEDFHAEDNTLISDQIATDIQAYAKQILLQKKIKDVNFKALADDKKATLQTALNDLGNNTNIPASLGVLGIPEALKGSITPDRTSTKQANLKHFELQIADLSEVKVLDAGKALTYQGKDADEFLKILDLPQSKLETDQIADAQAILEARYIVAFLPQANFSEDELNTLAKTTDVAKVRTQLTNKIADLRHTDKSITQENVIEIRKKALKQLIINKIKQAKGNESDVLNLMDLKNANSVQQVNAALKKIEALLDPLSPQEKITLIDSVVKTAGLSFRNHAIIQYNLLNGTPQQLQALIGKDELDSKFKKQFRNDHDIIKDYFENSQNSKFIRQTAFLGYMKTRVPELTKDQLENFFVPLQGTTPVDTLRTISGNLLGLGIADDIIDDTLVNNLKPYVATELAFRENKDKTYIEMLGIINGTTLFDPKYKDILPAAEKNKLTERLAVEFIGKAPSSQIAELIALAKAKDDAKAKEACEALKITDSTWLNNDNIRSIQQAALHRTVQLRINEMRFGDNRKKLAQFIKSLPEATQLALIGEESKALTSLGKAQSIADVRLILNELIPSSALVDDFISENRYLNSLSKIHNSEVAERLSQKTPQSLDDNQLNEINALLNPRNPTDLTSPLNYIITVQEISKKMRLERAGLDNEFIITDSNTSDEAIRDSVIKQYKHNKPWLDALGGGDTAKTFIISAFLPIKKTNDLSSADIDPLMDAIREKDYGQFVEYINTNKAKFPFASTWQDDITPTTFAEFKAKLNTKTYLNLRKYESLLDNRRDELVKRAETLFSYIVKFGSKIESSMEKLKKLYPNRWYNPYQSLVGRNEARQIESEVTDVANTCRTVLTQLTLQKEFLERELSSFPTPSDVRTIPNDEQRKKIEKRRDLIQKHIVDVKTKIAKYEPMVTIFYGDPAKPQGSPEHKGVLSVIADAKNQAQTIYVTGYGVSYEDIDLNEKERLVTELSQPKYKSKPSTEANTDAVISEGADKSSSSSQHYTVVPAIPPNKFRLYTMTNSESEKKITFKIIEERKPSTVSTDDKGQERVTNPTRFRRVTTCTKYIDNEGNEKNTPAQDQVETMMWQATLQLANQDPPYTIKGSSTEDVALLWTAFYVLSKKSSIKTFDIEKDVIVDSKRFMPENERSGRIFKSFTEDSCYSRVYKEVEDKLDAMIKQHEAIVAQKEHVSRPGQEKDIKKHTTKLFKHAKSEVVKRIEDDNDAQQSPFRIK